MQRKTCNTRHRLGQGAFLLVTKGIEALEMFAAIHKNRRYPDTVKGRALAFVCMKYVKHDDI